MTDTYSLDTLLRLVVDASKELVKVKKSAGIVAYLRGLWRARVKQQEALDLLPTAEGLAERLNLDATAVDSLLEDLEKLGLICKVDLSPDEGPFFLATFEGIACAELPTGSLSEGADDTLQMIQARVNSSLRSESYSQFLESLTGETRLNGKMVVFGLFLILTGAVTRSSALRIEFNESSKELEYLEALTKYLDDVSRSIFPQSADVAKGRKSGKTFRLGDLDNFFRRRKQMEQAVGPEVFVFDPPLYYFELYGDGREPQDETVIALLRVLLSRAQELSIEGEWIPENIKALVRRYQYDNPIKVSHRQAMFLGSPPGDWYFSLEYYLDSLLGELASS